MSGGCACSMRRELAGSPNLAPTSHSLWLLGNFAPKGSDPHLKVFMCTVSCLDYYYLGSFLLQFEEQEKLLVLRRHSVSVGQDPRVCLRREANSPDQMRVGQQPIKGGQRYRVSLHPGTNLPARAKKVRPSSPCWPGNPSLDQHRPQHPDLTSIPLKVGPAWNDRRSFHSPVVPLSAGSSSEESERPGSQKAEAHQVWSPRQQGGPIAQRVRDLPWHQPHPPLPSPAPPISRPSELTQPACWV